MVTAPSRGQIVTAVMAVLALVGAGSIASASLQWARNLRAGWPPEADTYYLPSSRSLRLMSLGHTELAADLIAARSNVYFGTQLSNHGARRWLFRYIETAVDLDPKFHRLFVSGAAMIVYSGKKMTLDAFEHANALLERGIESFPYDWEIYFQLGFNLMFEMPQLADKDDPRAAKWRQRGVEALQQAALFEGVPYWLPNLVARMLTKRGSEEMAIKHLEQAYAVTSSEEARQQIRHKLVGLRGKQMASELEDARHRYQEMVEKRYPYAPDGFSIVAGARRDRAVDVGSLIESDDKP